MTRRRVLVLVHETLVPPDSTKGYSEQEIDEWRTEYDVTTSLRAMGHEVTVVDDRISMGRGQIIWRGEDGVYTAGTEPRCDGAVAAW